MEVEPEIQMHDSLRIFARIRLIVAMSIPISRALSVDYLLGPKQFPDLLKNLRRIVSFAAGFKVMCDTLQRIAGDESVKVSPSNHCGRYSHPRLHSQMFHTGQDEVTDDRSASFTLEVDLFWAEMNCVDFKLKAIEDALCKRGNLLQENSPLRKKVTFNLASYCLIEVLADDQQKKHEITKEVDYHGECIDLDCLHARAEELLPLVSWEIFSEELNYRKVHKVEKYNVEVVPIKGWLDIVRHDVMPQLAGYVKIVKKRNMTRGDGTAVSTTGVNIIDDTLTNDVAMDELIDSPEVKNSLALISAYEETMVDDDELPPDLPSRITHDESSSPIATPLEIPPTASHSSSPSLLPAALHHAPARPNVSPAPARHMMFCFAQH